MGDLAEQPILPGPARRPRRARRIVAAGIALLLVAALATYSGIVLTMPLGEATGSAEAPEVAIPDPVAFAVPFGSASAVSVTGAEQFPGTAGVDGILASGGETGPQPIASITKLIATLVILDANPIAAGEAGPTLTFSEADADLYDGYYVQGATIEPMKAGSRMSLHDALEVMLVTSATNYAEAVSRWAFGSRANFRATTAAWLAAHGFVDTTVVEPTGLDPGNVSTPVELIALGRLALANPVIAEIVALPALNVPGLEPASNTNTLVGDDGFTGIKTGTLDEAGSCLLFSAVVDVGTPSPITVIGAMLGGGSRSAVAQQAVALIDSITAGFHRVAVIDPGDPIGGYTTPWGEEARIVAGRGASLLTWSDMPIASSVDIKRVTTATDGADVGTATFVAGDEMVTVPLVLEGSIDGPDAWWRMTHPGEVLGG